MKQYIDKAAVVAEIEKKIKETESMQPKFDQFWAGQISAFKGILKIIDTFEVKEVDLDFQKELYKAFGQVKDFTLGMHIAKHFFELGIKAAQKGK